MTDSTHAHLHITLRTSQPSLSLSQPPPETFQLIVTARLISSSSSAPLTICTDRSVLDNGNHSQHNGLYRGVFQPLQSVSDPNRRIQLARGASPNYAYNFISPNLKERPWMRFETVPAVAEGELEIRHDLPLERIFEYAHGISAADIKPGETFRVKMSPGRIDFITWWGIGALDGELKEKKFAKWALPDSEGVFEDLMPGEEVPDVKKMQGEGWVFSERLEGLKVTNGTEDGVVFEFVK